MIRIEAARLYAGDGIYGDFTELLNRVRYDPSQDDVELLDTVVHELGHAIWNHNGWDVERSMVKSNEERIVRRFTHDLVTMLVRNPKLLRWIEGIINGRTRRKTKSRSA